MSAPHSLILSTSSAFALPRLSFWAFRLSQAAGRPSTPCWSMPAGAKRAACRAAVAGVSLTRETTRYSAGRPSRWRIPCIRCRLHGPSIWNTCPSEHTGLGPPVHEGVDRVPIAKPRRQPPPRAALLGDILGSRWALASWTGSHCRAEQERLEQSVSAAQQPLREPHLAGVLRGVGRGWAAALTLWPGRCITVRNVKGGKAR